MYEIYARIRDKMGLTDYKVSKLSGVNQSTFSDWKSGRSVPKQQKLEKIAEVLGVSLEYLMTGKEPEGYYLNEETARIAQEVYDDPDLRMLFDASRSARPEDIRLAADLLRRLKETNPYG